MIEFLQNIGLAAVIKTSMTLVKDILISCYMHRLLFVCHCCDIDVSYSV